MGHSSATFGDINVLFDSIIINICFNISVLTKTCATESCSTGPMAWCNCSECTEDLCNGGEPDTAINPPADETV